LAATIGLDTAVTVLVTGAGLDGELSESQVLAFTGPDPILRLGEADIARRGVLDWHPSEATALLATSSARPARAGRDAGRRLGVTLTDRSADGYSIALHRVIEHNRLAATLMDTTPLPEAEDIARAVCGSCEIDFERTRANAPPCNRSCPDHRAR
jgi:hypothetical protein